MTAPITFLWTGEAMVPVQLSLAKGSYITGRKYRLRVQDERSAEAHARYFATVHDLWTQLPEFMDEMFPSADALRKHALCMTGWCHKHSYAASSPEEAVKIATFMRSRVAPFALISVNENVVVELVPRSQSYRADGMRRADFNKSAADVIDWITNLLQIASEPVKREAGLTGEDDERENRHAGNAGRGASTPGD